MIIILDANNICHIAKHTIKDLSYKGEDVGIIFGFLRQIFYLSNKFKTDKFIFAWDSGKSFRKSIYPEYKAKRKERLEGAPIDEKRAFKQFFIIRKEVLPAIGFKNNFILTGYEADDIIGSIIKNNSSIEFLIVSTDSDLYQLLSSHVRIYNSRKKEIYTSLDFFKEWEILPHRWIEIKAISGCNSDGIEGIKGVGEKTACKYLKGGLNKKSKIFSVLNTEESKAIIDKNIK